MQQRLGGNPWESGRLVRWRVLTPTPGWAVFRFVSLWGISVSLVKTPRMVLEGSLRFSVFLSVAKRSPVVPRRLGSHASQAENQACASRTALQRPRLFLTK